MALIKAYPIDGKGGDPVLIGDESFRPLEEREMTRAVEIVPVDELSPLALQPRVYNALIYGGINRLDQLLRMTDSELMRLNGFGKACLVQLFERLSQLGLKRLFPLREAERLEDVAIKLEDRAKSLRSRAARIRASCR